MATKDQKKHETELGEIYVRFVLDSMVSIAYAVAKDFSQRLELYQDIDEEIAVTLTQLSSRYGFYESYPDIQNRRNLYFPIFGKPYLSINNLSDNLGEMAGAINSSPFTETLNVVINAAISFSENAQPTGFPMLRERTRSALVPFRSHLISIQGTALNESIRRTKSIFDLSAQVLKNPKIGGVFGIVNRINRDWPLFSNDTEGAKLIEKITIQLSDNDELKVNIHRDQFVRMQRVAEKGRNSINLVLGSDYENNDETLDKLITQLYAWGSDLSAIGQKR